MAFQRSELVEQRSKVRIFDEGYTPRGAGYTPVDGSHSGPRSLKKLTCGWYSSFCKNLERTSFGIYDGTGLRK